MSRWSLEQAASYYASGIWDRRGLFALLAEHPPDKLAFHDGVEAITFGALRARRGGRQRLRAGRGHRRADGQQHRPCRPGLRRRRGRRGALRAAAGHNAATGRGRAAPDARRHLLHGRRCAAHGHARAAGARHRGAGAVDRDVGGDGDAEDRHALHQRLVRDGPPRAHGWRPSSVGELSFERCRVPDEALLGEPIARFQLIQTKIVDMRLALDTSRYLTYRFARLLDQGEMARNEVQRTLIAEYELGIRQ